MALPERTEAAQTAFVDRLRADGDPTAVVDAIDDAVQARRPMLAARLFALLDDHVEIPPGSALERASRAAQLWLRRKEAPEERSWSQFEDDWETVREARVWRYKQRMRDRLSGTTRRIGRLDGKKTPQGRRSQSRRRR